MNAQIIITLSEKGELNVSGPLENKLFCLGLLELSKDVVKAFVPAAQPLVQPASTIPNLREVPR